jgi:flavodoxin
MEGKATVEMTRAEQAEPEDFARGDVLILASGTWNTGGIEGQLNPHMHDLFLKRAAAVDLKGKTCAVIALGDERYHYTARAGEHLSTFVASHGGKECCEKLTIVNEPYGQEDTVKKWGAKFLASIT